MLSPDDARARIHELIDQIPDEQIGMLWMTFQSMLGSTANIDDEDHEDDYDDSEEDEGYEDDLDAV